MRNFVQFTELRLSVVFCKERIIRKRHCNKWNKFIIENREQKKAKLFFFMFANQYWDDPLHEVSWEKIQIFIAVIVVCIWPCNLIDYTKLSDDHISASINNITEQNHILIICCVTDRSLSTKFMHKLKYWRNFSNLMRFANLCFAKCTVLIEALLKCSQNSRNICRSYILRLVNFSNI